MSKFRPSESLRRAYQGLNASFTETRATLTLPQAAILRVLLLHGPLTQTQIVGHSGVDRSTTGDTLKRLATMGFVVAARLGTDKRANLVILTPAGLKAVQKADGVLGDIEAAMMRRVPLPDRAAFLRGLQAIAEAV